MLCLLPLAPFHFLFLFNIPCLLKRKIFFFVLQYCICVNDKSTNDCVLNDYLSNDTRTHRPSSSRRGSFLSLSRAFIVCVGRVLGPLPAPERKLFGRRHHHHRIPITNNKQLTIRKKKEHTHTDAHAHEKDFVHCALRILISIEFVCSYFATLHDSMSSSTSRLLINFLNERDGGNVRSFFFSFSLGSVGKTYRTVSIQNTCTPGSPGSLSFTAVSVLVWPV